MDHKEQIVAYLYSRIISLKEQVNNDQLTKSELIGLLEIIEELLRDYFNLSD